MARLVPVKCPNCGANVRIDPDRDYATCDYCKTSSFVQTPARRLPEEARQQNQMTFDVEAYQSALRSGTTAVWIYLLFAAAVAVVTLVAFLTNLPRQASLAPVRQDDSLAEHEGREYGLTGSKLPEGQEPTPTATVPLGGEPPKLSVGTMTISGRLAAEVVEKVVRKHHNRFAFCHRRTVHSAVGAYGTLTMRFVIGRDGGVSNAAVASSTISSAEFASCVRDAFAGMLFPRPPAGIVTVVYPLVVEQG